MRTTLLILNAWHMHQHAHAHVHIKSHNIHVNSLDIKQTKLLNANCIPWHAGTHANYTYYEDMLTLHTHEIGHTAYSHTIIATYISPTHLNACTTYTMHRTHTHIQ